MRAGLQNIPILTIDLGLVFVWTLACESENVWRRILIVVPIRFRRKGVANNRKSSLEKRIPKLRQLSR